MTTLEKRPPSESSEDSEVGEGSRHRRVYRRKKSQCDGRLWIFLVLGAVILVLGIVIGGLYFNIRTLTESTQLTEVTPTYVSAIAVLCSSLSVALLFWRRLTCLVFLCVITCTVTAFLCGITAILTGTHIVRPLLSLSECFYFQPGRECRCRSPYRRNMLEIQYAPADPSDVVYGDTDSCESIEDVLLHMLLALVAMYVLSFLLTVAAAILALLVLRMEKIRLGLFEDDTYEEIYTVSNSSGTPPGSDSDEHQHMIHTVLPSSDDNRMPGPSRIITRSRSYSQPKFPISAEGAAAEKALPKITVTSATGEQSGKLKEHRRRNRRAATIHNLDTHQLMVILSLQMRYLQESENAKSQTTLNAQQLSQQLRRALTPQPNQDRQNHVRQVRSHTPQPYHFKRSSYVDSNVPNYENMFDPSEFIRQMQQERGVAKSNVVPAERELCPTKQACPKTPRQGYPSQTLPPPRKTKTPVRLNYYEEIDDMVDCLDDSSASEQIYENQETRPLTHRVKGEGQAAGHVTSDGEGQKDITNILPALYPSIPRHLFDRSQTPSRPKSYLNAVDASDSPQVQRRDQSVNREQSLNRDQSFNREQPNLQLNQANAFRPAESASNQDIYAMPKKAQPPAKPARSKTTALSSTQKSSNPNRPALNKTSTPNSPSLPSGDGRSAFHAVPRSSKKSNKPENWTLPSDAESRLQVSARPYGQGQVEDMGIQAQSNHVSNVSAFFPPPPYSPPPSYGDVMSHSRDSSLHSLTSSTSTSDDVDFYQQIRRPSKTTISTNQGACNPSFSNPNQLKPVPVGQPKVTSAHQGGSNSVLNQLWGNTSSRPESIPYSGPPTFPEMQHSANHNGQYSVKPNGEYPQYAQGHSISRYGNFEDQVRSRERLTNQRTVQGSDACYSAMPDGNSSDSDCMETVI